MGVVVPIRREEKRSEVPDAVLVSRVLGDDDERAKEMIYRRHVRMVTGMAHRLLGGREVDDLVQDVFVIAFEKLDTLRDAQSLQKWLGTIVVFQARKRIRRKQLRRRWFRSESEPLDVERLVGAQAPPDVATELRALYRIVESLDADVRIALVLRRVEGLTINEISAHMNKSPATVKRRIRDGEERLRAAMQRGENHATRS